MSGAQPETWLVAAEVVGTLEACSFRRGRWAFPDQGETDTSLHRIESILMPQMAHKLSKLTEAVFRYDSSRIGQSLALSLSSSSSIPAAFSFP